MASREANGRSSIYEDANGRWHGYVTIGIKDNGAPDRRHREGRTKTEVTRKIQRLENERDAGKATKAGRAPTVEAWIETYLDTIAIRKLGRKSHADYWSLARNWIVPHLGKHRLDRLLPEHLDKLYSRMEESGKAPATVLKVHRVLSRALEVAYRREKVGRNVAKMVDAPSVSEIEITPLERQEARAILATASHRRNGLRWSVALALGLRQGEALGLRWQYIDLDTSIIKVWWQLQRLSWRHGCKDAQACGQKWHVEKCTTPCQRHRVNKRGCPKPCAKDCRKHAEECPQKNGGGLVFRPPKGKSKRAIRVPPELIPLLRAHQETQKQEKESAGELWQEHDLLFPQPDGRPADPRADWKEWKEVLTAAGVRDARVHDTRHTAATLLIEQGVHVRTVQDILGHSDIRLTQRYTHTGALAGEDAAARMGQALWGA